MSQLTWKQIREEYIRVLANEDPEGTILKEGEKIKLEEDFISIKSRTCGEGCDEMAKIMVNGVAIECGQNNDDNYNGLHMVIMDGESGKILKA